MSPQIRIMLIFAMHALVVGGMFSRLPEIQREMNLSPGEFGLLLMAIPIGVFTGSMLVSRLIETVGTRVTCLIFIPVFAAMPFFLTQFDAFWGLCIVLFGFGAALAAGNVAFNVEADRVEFSSGVRVLNKCHGSWGLGFLVSSLLGVLAIRFGISPMLHFILLFVAIALGSATIIRTLTQAASRESQAAKGATSKTKVALPNKGTFLIVGFALTGFWLEGSTRNWGVIYLRDGFGALEWYAALALPAMTSMQTLGRFLADGWISRFGPVAVARVLTCVALLGLLTITAAQSTSLALIGFLLMGLGISTAVPQAISAAARWGDRPSAQNVAAFSMLQTLIAFIAPPIFGLIASWFDMRMAWALFLPLPLIALYFANSLAPRAIKER